MNIKYLPYTFTEHGAEIAWLTDEKANERFNSDEYCSRDLFSRYGL